MREKVTILLKILN